MTPAHWFMLLLCAFHLSIAGYFLIEAYHWWRNNWHDPKGYVATIHPPEELAERLDLLPSRHAQGFQVFVPPRRQHHELN